ncbi:MAG: RidA family protein [Ignavibacteriales bacterium]|nr:RidA family protein [Ignavibacteriales bacterium]MCF8307151.1 RidA family protein [Ignavibacteriales bacterium]MCF8316809.1 RidA family protein [Ignavibacteriales bacterium]MCF8438385.1 RidA family protein [Ignavibacteriales bacterium]
MINERLKELGIEIPEAPKPLAAYVPALRTGNYVFTAGQLPLKNGELLYSGKVGRDITAEDAVKAAEICAINCLSAVKTAIGDLNKIKQIVKIVAFVASAEGFTAQPAVANGASELMLKIFGESGKHARSAVGVAELPRGASVEIEMIVEVN